MVNGDGTPVRSYLYASDLVIWLLTILARGTSCQPYNVGSEVNINIQSLATTVAQCFEPAREVQVAIKPIPDKPIERYVPSTEKSQTGLGLRQHIGLSKGIRKTILWYDKKGRR